MTYKQIESSREVRLWVTQILVPAVMVGTMILTIPEVRQEVSIKVKHVKESIRNKFAKGRG
jgi:hypothetical protein